MTFKLVGRHAFFYTFTHICCLIVFRTIIQFEVEEAKEEEELKVSWKEVEAAVRDAHSGLKIVYARGNGHKG